MSDQNGGGSANGYVKAFLLGNLSADPEMRYHPDKEQVYKSCSSLEEGKIDLFGNYAVGRFVISLFDRMIQYLIENGRGRLGARLLTLLEHRKEFIYNYSIMNHERLVLCAQYRCSLVGFPELEALLPACRWSLLLRSRA